jgi:3'(2'), 5'-bisphosphate nucleotidase
MNVVELWEELASSLVPLFQDYRGRLAELRVTEKPDSTLLSEADLALQEHITSRLAQFDPSARFLAEEQDGSADPVPSGHGSNGRLWVVDPIDGTSEFLQADRVEFCSVVCLLEELRPTAALVVAPELGVGRGSVCVHVAGEGAPVVVNGDKIRQPPSMAAARRASVTRSAKTPPRSFESRLVEHGYELKTRTTSQTLDLVRTCVDLAPYTEARLRPFGLFYREAQKVWDGAAGICLARAVGLRATDRDGRDRVPVDPMILQADEPCFDATLVASPPVAAWFLTLLGEG